MYNESEDRRYGLYIETSAMGSLGFTGPLYRVDQMPKEFQERYIIRGYRHPRSSPKQCVLSLFGPTNETLNFWTHFIALWYHMWVLRATNDTHDFRHDPYTWPLLAYICACCVTTSASSLAHTFNSISGEARHFCFFLDYMSLSILSLGLSLAIKAYSFPSDLRETWYGNTYIAIAFVYAILCTLFSCQTRFMQPSGQRQVLRLSSFAVPYLLAIAPLVYRLTVGTAEEMTLPSCRIHVRSIILLSLGSFLYATHLPERIFPGIFDIVGQSHQLLHIFTTFGARESALALMKDMEDRKDILLLKWEFENAFSTIGILTVLFVINVFILLGFSRRLGNVVQEKTH